MVLFQVGGIKDTLSMRAEFQQGTRYDKWMRNQMQIATRRMQREQMYSDYEQQYQQVTGQQLFGVPNDGSDNDKQ